MSTAPAMELSAAPQSAARERRGPWRVGLLGAGYIADWHAKAIRSSGRLALAAVCDRVLSRAEAVAAAHRAPHVYASLTDMLAGGAVDAVHVLLPPPDHFAAAREALRAGVHVYLEKPMCVEAGQCQELLEVARRNGRRVGAGHNFLFAESYQKLRADVKEGALGRLDHVTINWNCELKQLTSGPWDVWLLRDPRNVVLEIGPHVAAHLLDLVGEPEEVQVRVGNPVDLPNGRVFYRRWQVRAERGGTAVDLNLSLAAGFGEQTIHVRGSLAGATCDVGRNVYVARRHTTYMDDIDRYVMLKGEAAAIARQARANLCRYVLGKFKLSRRDSAYGSGIRAAVEAFYRSVDGADDARVSGNFGRSVIETCERIADASGLRPVVQPVRAAVGKAARRPGVLVLGASGFIGRELVRQLAAAGRPTRVLVRGKGRLPATLQTEFVEVVEGDASREQDLDSALEGIAHVYHLAKPAARTWAEYQRLDVEVTRLIAERCLAAGVERLIYTGSIASYYSGGRAGTITEETSLDRRIGRRNNYARSKARCEEVLLEMHRAHKLPVVIARPGIVLGRAGSPFHSGVGMWHHGAICRLWGDGENALPLVLVEDVAAGLVAMLDAPGIEGESFNFIGDVCLSAREYLSEFTRAAELKFDVRPTSVAAFYLADMVKWGVKVLVRHPERRRPSYRDWESRTQRAAYDCSKAKRVLNWRPVTDREELIRRGIVEPVREALA